MTACAQDYASEILYPDDLIPIEDLEGELLFSIYSFYYFFLTFIKIKPSPRLYLSRPQQQLQLQQQQQKMTRKTHQVKYIFVEPILIWFSEIWNPDLCRRLYSPRHLFKGRHVGCLIGNFYIARYEHFCFDSIRIWLLFKRLVVLLWDWFLAIGKIEVKMAEQIMFNLISVSLIFDDIFLVIFK